MLLIPVMPARRRNISVVVNSSDKVKTYGFGLGARLTGYQVELYSRSQPCI